MYSLNEQIKKIDEEIKDLFQEKNELVQKNMEIKREETMDFLKENLKDLSYKVSYNKKQKSLFLHVDEDSEIISNFGDKLNEVNNYDPTVPSMSSASFYFWDDNIDIYVELNDNTMRIRISDISLTRKFIREFLISDINFENINEEITHAKNMINEFSEIKNMVK